MIKKSIIMLLLVLILFLLEHFVINIVNEENFKKNRANCGLNLKLISDIYFELKNSELKEEELMNELKKRVKNKKDLYSVTHKKNNFADCLFFMNPDFESSESILIFCDDSMHPGYRHVLLCNGDVCFIKEEDFKRLSFNAYIKR